MPIVFDTQGLHPTTEACLRVLQSLQDSHDFMNILEIGCGSGILSLAAASIWEASIMAVDISEKAVQDTRNAAMEYELDEQITTLRSDGCSNLAIGQNAPYDLVICNLLADTLLQVAHDLKKYVKTNGYCIFSGMLEWRSQEVEHIYQGLGFEILEKTTFSPWQLLLLCNKRKT